MADDTVGWMALATSKSVVRRATVVAFIVGSILVVINGDAIVHGDLSAGRLLRIVLTVSVPYCVSTYSSVSALRALARQRRGDQV